MQIRIFAPKKDPAVNYAIFQVELETVAPFVCTHFEHAKRRGFMNVRLSVLPVRLGAQTSTNLHARSL